MLAKPTTAKHVVELRSDTFRVCPVCGSSATHMQSGSKPTMEEKINHVLAHGYILLHIGQETATGLNGEPWQETVAFLGKYQTRRASTLKR